MAEAEALVAAWLDQPMVGQLESGERHWEILRRLTIGGQVTGSLVMDAAWLQSLSNTGRPSFSTGRDFSRFVGLTWLNPLSP